MKFDVLFLLHKKGTIRYFMMNNDNVEYVIYALFSVELTAPI